MFEFTKWELIEPSMEETMVFSMLAPTIVQPRNYNNKDKV